MKKIDVIVGARPNYMKAAPVMESLKKRNVSVRFIHTGQHYDQNLSANLLSNLELPKEDLNFKVGSGSHANQTAKVMIEYEKATNCWLPDTTIVFGDVNSTIACALVAQKKGIDVVHVEAGCRSKDMTMPEEVNRIMVDHISKFLFCVSEFDKKNLERENIKDGEGRVVKVVGDTMIDSLKKCEPSYEKSSIINRLSLDNYLLCTIHRPSNVDDEYSLNKIVELLISLSKENKVVFPIHPRTRKLLLNINMLDILLLNKNLVISEPLNYFDFMKLQKNAKCIVTDSGGIQSEACAFGVPCLTMRDNTERPHTLIENGGTNRLVGGSPESLNKEVENAISKRWIAKMDDKKSGELIVEQIMQEC